MENLELEAITSTLHELNHGLQRHLAVEASSSPAEKGLQELCKGCGNVTDQLIEVIKCLRAQGLHTGWNSFRQALKSLWKEDQIKALSIRLDRYRNQIDTTLLVSLRENMTSIQVQLTAEKSTVVQHHGSSLHELHTSIKSIEQWQTNVFERLMSSSWEPRNQLDVETLSTQLSATAEQQRDGALKLRILENLRYASIEDRLERIPIAYSKTFDWIFLEDEPVADLGLPKPTSEGEDVENVSEGENDHPWDNFVHWLRSDEDLYWITGKPGSGKSTLVKYLYADPRARQHLQTWRGESDLTVAGFFFWNSGTSMQMSERGLIQTLLFQAISDRPELIPTLFPDRWRYSQLFGIDLSSMATCRAKPGSGDFGIRLLQAIILPG